METIHQSVTLDCPAHAFYETFLDEDQHADFTKSEVAINPEIGGSFSAYNEELVGEFMQLVPDRLIVMIWRPTMPGWPENHYATIRMELMQSSDGTTVDMTMVDVPTPCVEAITEGWRDYYWNPLTQLFAW